MNIAIKGLIAGIALLVAVHGRAQSVTTAPPSGVLGQRLVEAGSGITKDRFYSNPRYNANIGGTLPLARYLDLSVGYHYSYLNPWGGTDSPVRLKATTHAVSATETAYFKIGRVKPFVAAGLTHLWTKQTTTYFGTPVIERTDRDTVWQVALGTEIPWARVTITPSVTYTDTLRREEMYSYNYRSRTDALIYETNINYWINRSVGTFLKVSRFDPLDSQAFAWAYTVGARYRF